MKKSRNDKYKCETCDFMTYKKTDYNRHLITNKHKSNLLTSDSKYTSFTCEFCKKNYKDRTGLWKHKKICNTSSNSIREQVEPHVPINEIQEMKNFMKYLIKENSEMKNMMMEVIKSVEK